VISDLYNIQNLEDYLSNISEEFIQYRKNGYEFVLKKLIELGQTLGVYPEAWKTKSNKVVGCSAKVYVNATLVNNKVFFVGTSESDITRGLIAILINGLNQLTPTQIVNESEAYFNNFVKNTDVKFSMTVNRANSLGTLYQFMKKKAQEYLNS
jgi:cysteine desulfuration protein SufE